MKVLKEIQSSAEKWNENVPVGTAVVAASVRGLRITETAESAEWYQIWGLPACKVYLYPDHSDFIRLPLLHIFPLDLK
jgi:hypothetical protein